MTDIKVYNKMSIFDMDGTLLASPLPETGKLEYEKNTGNKWPYPGWWGRLESLHPSFDIPVYEEIVAEYKKAMQEEQTLVVLMTNRLEKFKPRVLEILTEKSLEFDLYSFNEGYHLPSYIKAKRVLKLLSKYPAITEIEFWDDDPKHFPDFEDLKKTYIVNLHLVQR